MWPRKRLMLAAVLVVFAGASWASAQDGGEPSALVRALWRMLDGSHVSAEKIEVRREGKADEAGGVDPVRISIESQDDDHIRLSVQVPGHGFSQWILEPRADGRVTIDPMRRPNDPHVTMDCKQFDVLFKRPEK